MTDRVLKELEKTLGKNRIKLNEPMSKHTTFKVGGEAKYYLEVEQLNDLVKVIRLANKLEIQFYILGMGSNILVSDEGITGIVIKNNCRKFDLMQMGGRIKNREMILDKVVLFSESGAIMNQIVRFTLEKSLEGLECHLGLPGTVGGAIYMNSNFPKKNSSVGDVLEKATILTSDGEIKDVDKAYFKFGYDQSAIQKSKEIVLSVVFKLKTGNKEDLWNRATEALEYRQKTYPDKPSAGCIFRNITKSQAIKASTPEGITSAGYFIDKSGLKGERIGDAMISDVHANFIVNMGQAKAKDILELINLMKLNVNKKFGVELQPEVELIGFN